MVDTPEDKKETQAPLSDKTEPKRKRRRGRRLLVVVTILVLLLVLLVGLAPTIASSQTGARYIASTASGRLKGAVSLDGLAVSWFGDTGVRGLKVSDADGQEVLSVGSASITGGLWHLLTTLAIPEQLSIEAPRVVLYLDEQGRPSLLDAVSPVTPSAEEETTDPSALPNIKLNLREGSAKVVSHTGAEYEVSGIGVEVEAQSAGAVKASLKATLADGTGLTGDVELQNLLAGGQLDPMKADGSVRLKTDKHADLGRLISVVDPSLEASGQLALKLEASFKDGSVDADFETDATGLAVKTAGTDASQPSDVGVSGSVHASADEVSGHVDLRGEPGIASARFRYPLGDKAAFPPPEQLLSALLDEEPVELPDLELQADGSIDLPALARAVPALLRIRPGTRIESGTLDLHSLKVAGGAAPEATAAVTVAQLAGATAEGPVRCDPISVNLEIGAGDKRSLQVRRADLSSSFATVAASGAPSAFKATVDGDLGKLFRQVGQLVELDIDALEGTIQAAMDVKRLSDDRLDVTLKLTGEALRYKHGEQDLNVGRLLVQHEGAVTMSEGRPTEVSAKESMLDIDDQVNLVASGRYSLDDQGFDANVEVKKLALDYAGQRAADAGIEGVDLKGGNVALSANISKPPGDAPIQSNGQLNVPSLSVGDTSLDQGIELRWTGAKFAPADAHVAVESAALKSQIASVDATGVDCRFSGDVTLAGDLKGQADLERLASLAAKGQDAKAPPAVSGHLTFQSACRSDKTGTSIEGNATVGDLLVRAADGVEVKDNVRLTYNAALDPKGQTLDVNDFQLLADALSANFKGQVRQLKTSADLDLQGNYEADWPRLMQIIHRLAPATKELVTITGKSQGPLKVRGPVSEPKLDPPFAKLAADTSVGWKSAEVYGIPLGGLTASPRLSQAKLLLPKTTIRAANGSVGIGGQLDLSGKSPVLESPPELAVLKDIEVTPKLGEQLLSRFNPIFGKASRMEGTLALDVKAVKLPLGSELTTGGAGSGRLSLNRFKVQPSAIFATLLELGGMGSGEMYAVEVSGLDFRIRKGRIEYKDFVMRFAERKFDLKFYGSVGFDDTLDLIVSVPVRKELLTKLGVQGPVADYAKKLAGSRVDIPLVGTRQDPRLDLGKVDTKKLLENVIKGELLDDGKKLLGEEGLLGDKNSKGKKTDGKSRQDDAKKAGEDLIGDLLKKDEGQQKNKKKSK